MNSALLRKNILVTGGAGSIGSEIVRQALANGATKVIIFSRDEIKHFLIRKEIIDNRLQTVVGDIRDIKSLERVFIQNEIDIIFHAAAMKHVVICEEAPLEAVRTNIIGTSNVVDLSVKYKIPKLVAISTDKAARPINVMGATKFLAESLVLNATKDYSKGQLFSCVRFGNVAASRGSVIPLFVDNLLKQQPLVVTDLEVTRFIIRIPDAVELVLKAAQQAKGGEIFILKMRAFLLKDLVDVMRTRIAPRLKIKTENVITQITGLTQGEKIHEVLIGDANEAMRTIELEDMYVVSRQTNPVEHRNQESPLKYDSSNVERLSCDELEHIVIEYIKNQLSLKV